jgi:hypothetical protein
MAWLYLFLGLAVFALLFGLTSVINVDRTGREG